jgi:hypothetical protein
MTTTAAAGSWTWSSGRLEQEVIVTETEWLACADPQSMLTLLQDRRVASERKFRLFTASCCRRLWPLLTDERSRAAVGTAERAADGRAAAEERDAARQAAFDAVAAAVRARQQDPALPEVFILAARAAAIACGSRRLVYADAARAVVATCSLIARRPASGLDRETELGAYCAALRDLFGYPLKPAPVVRSEWLTSTVVSLARNIYDSRSFELLPVLGDALLDAGCHEEGVLDHCRNGGEHHRGCWVVDLVLNQS